MDRAYDQALADAYDQRHFGGRSGQLVLRKDLAALAALLPPAPGRLLDIPCGTGIYTAQLAGLGYAVVPADASAAMLVVVGQRGLAGARLCSIHELPFAAGTFDGTVTLRLFSHFTHGEIAQALSELRRVIRPGGRMVFDTFRWTPRRWPVVRRFVAQEHIHEIAPAQVERLIGEAGLRIVTVETRYLFSPIWQRKLPYGMLKALTAVETRLPDRWLLRTFWACTRDA